MIVYCEMCGKELNRKPSQLTRSKAHVCSKECRIALLESRANTVKCQVCGKEVKRPPAHAARSKDAICCSHTCLGKWQRAQAAKQGLGDQPSKCIVCGKAVTRPNKRKSKQHLCSKECRIIFMRKLKSKPKVSKVCPVCGKIFFVSPSIAEMRVTCSRACGGILRSKLQRGKNNGRYIHGKAEERYPLEFRHVAEAVRNRDNRECLMCGAQEDKHLVNGVNVQLHVHHIDYNLSLIHI